MSMSIALPRPNLSACMWKATKVVAGGAVFIAMSLPIAFPARDANPALAPVASMSAPQPSPAQAVKAKSAMPAKVEAAQAPAKKPSPKNA